MARRTKKRKTGRIVEFVINADPPIYRSRDKWGENSTSLWRRFTSVHLQHLRARNSQGNSKAVALLSLGRKNRSAPGRLQGVYAFVVVVVLVAVLWARSTLTPQTPFVVIFKGKLVLWAGLPLLLLLPPSRRPAVVKQAMSKFERNAISDHAGLYKHFIRSMFHQIHYSIVLNAINVS